MLLDERPQPILAEQIRIEVHRLGDAVREEHEDVAEVERNGQLLEQLLEALLEALDAQADDHARSASARAPRRRPSRLPARWISGVCPARA